MTTLQAFILGMIEFRRNATRSLANEYLLSAYDSGRELAHRLTFRYFES